MACPFCEPGRFESEVVGAFDALQAHGVYLTKQQARCMACLMSKSGVVTTDTLMAAIWGDKDEPEWAESSLKVHVSKCRKKIAQAKLPWKIRSVFGVGYVLERLEGKALRTIAFSLTLTLLCIYPVANILS